MDSKKCQNCIYFDNENYKHDKRTEHAGICSKMAQIVFLNDNCKMYQPVQMSINDIEVKDATFVLPQSQMSMYDIINFIN